MRGVRGGTHSIGKPEFIEEATTRDCEKEYERSMTHLAILRGDLDRMRTSA